MELVLDLDKDFSKQFLNSDLKELLKNKKLKFNKDIINNVEKNIILFKQLKFIKKMETQLLNMLPLY